MLEYVIPVLVSLVPGFVALARVAGMSSSTWLVAALGGGGWLLALVLRTPLLVLLQTRSPGLTYLLTASILAGVFEEFTRSSVLRSGFAQRDEVRSQLALGLGWGLTEALLVYTIPVVLSVPVYGYHWVDLLPGALERNSAIVIHLSLTMLLSKNPRSYKLLATSIVLHSIVNLLAVTALLTLVSVWLVELVIAATSASLFTVVALPRLRYLRRIRGN